MLFKKVESHSFSDWFKDSNLNSMDDIWMRCHLTSLCQNLKLLCCDQTRPKLFEIRQSKRNWHVFYYVYQMCEHWYFYLEKKYIKMNWKKWKVINFFVHFLIFQYLIRPSWPAEARSPSPFDSSVILSLRVSTLKSIFFTELRLTF